MASVAQSPLRREVIAIYKGRPKKLPRTNPFDSYSPELLEMGKSYPLGYDYFRPRVHKAFMSQAHLKDEQDIRKGIERAEYVKKEIEALYYLKKYRSLRKSYG
jgi:hypothetical protein